MEYAAACLGIHISLGQGKGQGQEQIHEQEVANMAVFAARRKETSIPKPGIETRVHLSMVPEKTATFLVQPKTEIVEQDEVTISPVVEPETIYTCEFCCKDFSSKETVILHKQDRHPNMTSTEDGTLDSEVEAETIHTCDFCSKAFSSKKSVQLHKQKKHSTKAGAGYADCGFCPSVFSRKLMILHIRKKHPEEGLDLPETKNNPWRLQVTEPASTQQIVVKKRFSCTFCPKAFGGKDFLERHTQLNHLDQDPSETNKTEEAGVLSHHASGAGNVNTKLLIMLLPDQIQSDENSTEDANVSLKQEDIETDYPTEEVEENVDDMLPKQEDIPSEDPADNATTWQCGTCEKYLKNKSSLQRHMLRHLEVKPFKCQFCGKQFTRNGLLKTHVQKHHTIDISSMEPKFSSNIVSLTKTASEPEPGTL